MKGLLKAFRNFFLLFALFVGLGILFANSKGARDFVAPTDQGIDPDFDIQKSTK